MKTVVQPGRGGPVQVLEVPRPVPGAAEVLVATIASVISPGAEQAAPPAPSRSRVTWQPPGRDGAADVPLGYSAAGEVIEAGTAVRGIRPGQLVATGGAGKACHAQFQAVPGVLCAVIPDGVPASDAAFAAVAATALHGLRLAEAGPGSKVVVSGLGLIGQLAARLAMAAGCDVACIDPAPHARAAAAGSGAFALDELGDATTGRVLDWSRGRGADAVLVCAASRSAVPAARAPALCRDGAPVVIVGDTSLDLDRTPLRDKELSLRFARGVTAARPDPAGGPDYPAGQPRWTEGRNFEAVLDLLAAGRLAVADLVTHAFAIDDAAAAYHLIGGRAEPYLAVQLSYPAPGLAAGTGIVGTGVVGTGIVGTGVSGTGVVGAGRAVGAGSGGRGLGAGRPGVPARAGGDLAHGRAAGDACPEPGVGWIGAGGFSARTLLPAFRAAGFTSFTAVASASGVSSRQAAGRHGFARAVSGGFNVIADPDTAVVVIATPHDTHAELAALGLRAGRHVWCEKPLALSLTELDQVSRAWQASGLQLAVGFSRRWSPAVLAARAVLAAAPGPRLLVYRVAAERVPDGHWYADPRHGGRLLGEVCQFVDTAQVLTGSPVQEAAGLGAGGPAGNGLAGSWPTGSGLAGRGPGDDAAVSLRFADGSLAVIAYGSVPVPGGREWIEVSAGGHRVIIDDFCRATADGKVIWKGRRDLGHRGSAAAFRRAVTGGAAMPVAEMLASTAATIRAAGIRD